ncbi:MAG: D-glycerate dehydrogenase, partial [Armatimonadetes bacterium]|nr:D-glycerate dehydrogenase [Armatimonadota bacterium]
MAKPRVYVTRIIPEQGLKIVREHCDMRIWEGDMPPPREIILKEITGCDGILSMLTDRMDGPVMDVAPRLRVISNCAVGYDNIDVPAATARKIVVGHTPGVLTETVADFAFALLLAAARRVVEGDKYTRARKWKTWEPMGLLGQDVHRATLGLVGLGRIGAAVAKRAQGFEMKVLYHDVVRREDLERSMGIQFTTLDTLLRESDFVSIHVPLLPETHHLIGAKELDKMKLSAVLVNTARGPIV